MGGARKQKDKKTKIHKYNNTNTHNASQPIDGGCKKTKIHKDQNTNTNTNHEYALSAL